MSAIPPHPAPVDVRPGTLLPVVVPAMLLMVVSTDMVNLVLPLMGAEFGAAEPQLAWVVSGFLTVFAVGIPCYGRLADRFPLRRLFVVALAINALGSLGCALAPTLPTLVLGRIVGGAGAAAVPVLSVVAVTRLLPAAQRAMALGWISAAGGVGAAAGPTLGGGVGQLLGWRALFWLMCALAALLVAAVRRVLPAEPTSPAEPFDLLGGALLGAAAGLILLGVTEGQRVGLGAPSCWGCVLVGLACAGLFARRTATVTRPFVPPALFTNRRFLGAGLTVALTMFVNLAVLVCVPLLVVDVGRLSPGEATWVMVPGGFAVALLSPVAGRLLARTGAVRGLTVGGLTTIGAATLFLSATAGTSPLPAALGVLGLGAGIACTLTAATDAGAGALPTDQVGVGLGVFQGMQFLGAGAGPAFAGALVAARGPDADAVNPLHTGAAGAYSDAFALLTGVALLAGACAWRATAPREECTVAAQQCAAPDGR